MSDEPDAPTLEVVTDDGSALTLFQVVTWTDAGFRVRAPARFEVGEELRLKITRGRALSEARVRVARHVDSDGEVVTALDLLEETPLRSVITG